MKFRTRLLIAFGVVVLIPLLVFGLGIRAAMSRRVSAEYEGRVNSLVDVIRADLTREEDRISARLKAVRERMVGDNTLRSAVLRRDDRGYILDYASDAMRLAGLDFLQIQDADHRVVSSGHFRNEFDRTGAFVTSGGVTLVRAPTAEGPFLVLARPDTVRIAGQVFDLVGGIAVDSAYLVRLAPDPEFGVAIRVADSLLATSTDSLGDVVANLPPLPYVDAAEEPTSIKQASVVVTHSSGLLGALQSNVNFWFGVAVLVAALAALLLAGWLSTRISEPVEARIAIGDIARQVTHDIKNGLAPLRNVFRHLTQVARDKPEELPQVFTERQGTVESSINYLETLAANYAKLSPVSERKATDVNTVVRETIGASSVVKARLAEGLPPVSADALVLRRVIENLVSNAVDSLDGKNGTVTVTTERGKGIVRIAVSDTGKGMSKADLDRAFDDFYTTKAGGTGLGLSIVRRLVLDSNGSLQVDTEPGKGSTFIVEIPSQ